MNFIRSYFNSFKGLAREIWIFALVILINRSGLMVTTFLAVYLHTEFGYSIAESGSIMTFYGLGSLAGVWTSGRIADKVGYLKIQFFALVGSGVFILLMQFADSYWDFAALLFLAVFCGDMYRPANLASITQFSKFENRTRSLALVRLAINLGIAIGPAIGGFLIIQVGYEILFFVDGLTCIAAGIVLMSLLGLKDKTVEETREQKAVKKQKVKFPKSFKWLMASNFLWTFAFFQIIYTYPLFMKGELNFAEDLIGFTFTLNGLMIFLLEMPIVKMYEKYNKRRILYIGSVLCAISFVFLAISIPYGFANPWVIGVPLLYMLFITIGEIFYLPFAGAMAMNMAPKEKAAKFMGQYSLVFSFVHVITPFLGAAFADYFGFQKLWIVMFFIMISVIFFARKISNEKATSSE
ncbi:MAG: MFS transporter [Flavobacteriales bacterium]|nr:MFS transporter [Flavobacteriales bacterium]